ncbi:MAG: putative Na+/H+ antiporter, partial [Roseateles sp.]
PVLMVAAKWGFDLSYMITHIGWKAALAVFINAAVLTALNAGTLRGLTVAAESPYRGVPAHMVAVHVGFLTLIVLLSHHPAAFLSVFLLFMGVATAY